MFRRIGILILGTAACGAVAYLPMRFLVKDAPIGLIVQAAVVCLVPGVLVLYLAQRLRHKPPEAWIVGVLAATILRMAGALALGSILYLRDESVRRQVYPFVGWAVLFYIATLLIETALLYNDRPGAAKTNPSGS